MSKNPRPWPQSDLEAVPQCPVCNSSGRSLLYKGLTDRVFGVINRFRDQPGTRFKGVRIEIGEGENTVTIRFQEREVTAAMIEGVVNSLRQVLNEDQAPVAITIADGIQFDTGFAAKEFAKLVGIELKPGDVIQEN